MNVLVIGSGGREHALAWKINQSKSLTKLFCAPGNPGTEKIAKNVNLPDNESILNFCKKESIDLVVVGPELPLVNGITDYLEEEGIKVFGPSKSAARIEGDKSFSKDLMKKYGIPTADYQTFSSNQFEEALNYLKNSNFPVVLKASGLAAGKGVLICKDFDSASEGLKQLMLDKVFDDAGENVVIEEFMTGQEASVFAITDGKEYVTLPAAQDHKRIFDGDKGKNTGGMGAYAPAPLVDDNLLHEIKEKIIEPTISAMAQEGIPYKGCLYCGLMITENGPKVVEFNCRFGDPETQCVLPVIEGDFLKLLYSAAAGNLDKSAVRYNGGSSVCVVAASNGYPGAYQKGFEILGLDTDYENCMIFHAGTKKVGNVVQTNGGRVLGITSFIKENNLRKAKTIAYETLSKINFDGIYYRKDISDKAFIK
ncbi:MAG: phosphoribosylamine--glycine ligase [Ignavibacteria bacterium]|nr:MAG: phosphoribosylamine--glycine ligase [Ignavibacteria bacterium]